VEGAAVVQNDLQKKMRNNEDSKLTCQHGIVMFLDLLHGVKLTSMSR
jgi:hypothetical protein